MPLELEQEGSYVYLPSDPTGVESEKLSVYDPGAFRSQVMVIPGNTYSLGSLGRRCPIRMRIKSERPN